MENVCVLVAMYLNVSNTEYYTSYTSHSWILKTRKLIKFKESLLAK